MLHSCTGFTRFRSPVPRSLCALLRRILGRRLPRPGLKMPPVVHLRDKHPDSPRGKGGQ